MLRWIGDVQRGGPALGVIQAVLGPHHHEGIGHRPAGGGIQHGDEEPGLAQGQVGQGGYDGDVVGAGLTWTCFVPLSWAWMGPAAVLPSPPPAAGP